MQLPSARGRKRSGDGEGTAAAAGGNRIGVAHLEGGADQILDEIDLRSGEQIERRVVDHHFDPIPFKEMIVDSDSTDIVYTPAISGVNANFLRPSIVAAGRDPDDLSVGAHSSLSLEGEAKVWRDIWSAGQGVGGIHDVLSTADLCARLTAEYRATIARMAEELNLPHVPTA